MFIYIVSLLLAEEECDCLISQSPCRPPSINVLHSAQIEEIFAVEAMSHLNTPILLINSNLYYVLINLSCLYVGGGVFTIPLFVVLALVLFRRRIISAKVVPSQSGVAKALHDISVAVVLEESVLEELLFLLFYRRAESRRSILL